MNLVLLEEIFRLCIVPLFGILTKYIVDVLAMKRDEINTRIDSETVKKYTNMINATISECVIATNQTYVNSLKGANAFDEAAQKEAFKKTKEAVLMMLSEDMIDYIIEISGDINIYLEQKIEAEVNKNRA